MLNVALLTVRMVILAAISLIAGRVGAPPTARMLGTGTRLLHVRRLRTPTMDAGGSPCLLLTSAGLVTPALEASFRRMLLRTSVDGVAPKIAMLVTAQMAGGLSQKAPTEGDSDGSGGKKRSAGELRRRRWAAARDGAAIERSTTLGHASASHSPTIVRSISSARLCRAGKKGEQIGSQLGIEVQCVDCARVDQPAALYREPLLNAECIWVAGGNTFYLWYWMKQSGPRL